MILLFYCTTQKLEANISRTISESAAGVPPLTPKFFISTEISQNACFYLSTLDARFRTSYGVCQCLRMLSSSIGYKKFDFTDLTRPESWYPIARRKKRKVILHVGPTNSGKTYHALKRLQLSSSGIYCGPLRLLAWEVAHRLNKAKVPCDLVTGQEREEIEGAKHKSVTVEMADVTCNYSCAVVDEIQMLGCKTRGFSFTRALLGISADELRVWGCSRCSFNTGKYLK